MKKTSKPKKAEPVITTLKEDWAKYRSDVIEEETNEDPSINDLAELSFYNGAWITMNKFRDLAKLPENKRLVEMQALFDEVEEFNSAIELKVVAALEGNKSLN